MVNYDITAEVLFRQQYLTTRSSLLVAIEQRLQSLEKATQDDSNSPFYQARIALMRQFVAEVHNTALFEKLDIGWYYLVTLGSRGATLHLYHHEHVAIIEHDGDGVDLDFGDCDASFDLIKVNSRLLSSDEYAKRCGVSGDTIRMWIRRGKLRSAIKLGNSWKIPEVTEPVTRGFKDAQYEWHTTIEDAPAEFHFINEPGSLWIRRLRSKEHPFSILLTERLGLPVLEKKLSTMEVERLEAFLIAEPNIIYTGDLEYIQHIKEENK